MDSKILEEIKKKLDSALGESLKRLDELEKQDPYSDPSRLNDNAASDTEASEEADHDRVAALKNETKSKIERIKNSLAKIESGDYGKCEKCGAEIDASRLEIFPEATLCFECERKRE